MLTLSEKSVFLYGPDKIELIEFAYISVMLFVSFNPRKKFTPEIPNFVEAYIYAVI